jgi:thiazole synthase
VSELIHDNPVTLYDGAVLAAAARHRALFVAAILAGAIRASGCEIVTVSLRREAGGARAGEAFWSLIRDVGVRVLPNTAGCRTAKEAIATAQMAREVFATDWIKLEIIGEEDTLQPDVFGLVEAARARRRRLQVSLRPTIWWWRKSCSTPAAAC